MITYARINEDTYEATNGDHTVLVRKTWRRIGGHGWEVPGVKDCITPVFANTRKLAATKALARLARDHKEDA